MILFYSLDVVSASKSNASLRSIHLFLYTTSYYMTYRAGSGFVSFIFVKHSYQPSSYDLEFCLM